MVQVQLGTKAHVEDVQELLVGVTDMAATQAAFTAGVEANSAYVVCCQGQVHQIAQHLANQQLPIYQFLL